MDPQAWLSVVRPRRIARDPSACGLAVLAVWLPVARGGSEAGTLLDRASLRVTLGHDVGAATLDFSNTRHSFLLDSGVVLVAVRAPVDRPDRCLDVARAHSPALAGAAVAL